jgi:hypothetical protein
MREVTIEHEQINNFLKSGPEIPLTDKPLFKLVWCDDERELRTGVYRHFDANGTFLREESKTEWVPKYSWIKERYILEHWFSPIVAHNLELPLSINGSYEPIYVFEDANGNVLPLNIKVVEFIVQQSLKPQRSSAYIKFLLDEKLIMQEKKEDDREWDIISDEGPLVSQFHDGSAILNVYDNKSDKSN